MARMCFGKANDKQYEKLAVAEVGGPCGLPSISNSTAEMSVANQDCKSNPVMDWDGFAKMCDEINSLANEAEQGRLASNAQEIKEKVDKYIACLKHARDDFSNKSKHARSLLGRSVANYEMEPPLRFEDTVNRLRKLSILLDTSETELRNRMSTMNDLSRQLQSVIRILEHKLSKFLHEYAIAVANGAKSIEKERSIIVPEMNESSEDEDDDWKVVLPSCSETQADTKRKSRKNKKTKKANKERQRKKDVNRRVILSYCVYCRSRVVSYGQEENLLRWRKMHCLCLSWKTLF